MKRKRSVARLLLSLTVAVPALSQPTVSAVVNAASFETGVPRGCLVSIFGSRLAQSISSAATAPLPRKLGTTVVTVGDLEIEAPLYFVSPGQINAQIPFEVLGTIAPLYVTTSEGKSKPFLLTFAASGPGLFTRSSDGKGPAMLFGSNFQPLDAVTPGSPLIFYATGLGPTDPPMLSGSPGASAEPLNRVVSVPEVMIGEFPARVDFAGLAPGMAGVYQINVTPQLIYSDRLLVRSGGITSNVASIGSIAPQKPNVANVSGTIQAIYPTADPNADPITYSPLLLAVRFTARMDILASAVPFGIAAVSDAGTSLITIDPVAGTFEGTATEPTLPTRFGDFSGSEIVPVDLASCFSTGPAGGITCFPFPGSIIPASRIPPSELTAVQSLPLPDSAPAKSWTGVVRVRGSVRPGSTFAIDGENNSALSTFGGYLPIPLPPKPSGTTSIKLFVDGKLVASTDVNYRVLSF